MMKRLAEQLSRLHDASTRLTQATLSPVSLAGRAGQLEDKINAGIELFRHLAQRRSWRDSVLRAEHALT